MKRVLLASPVKQKKEILCEFLESLDRLILEGISLDMVFIDDNNNHKLLLEYRKGKGNVLVLAEDGNDSYVCDETTHRWQESLIWKVAELKNRFLALALEGDYDYLFLVDSDLYLQAQTLIHLISLGKDIVSEVFWTRWEPELPPLPQVWVGDQYRLFALEREEELSDQEKSKRTREFLKMLKLPGTYKVGGLGACTLLSQKALQAGVSFEEIYNLGFIGEDRHFGIRAVALGFELYADTHYPPFHIYRESELSNLTAFKQSKSLARPLVSLKRTKGLLTLAMLVRNEAERYLEQVLTQANQLADYVVILDDASEDKTVELCEEILAATPHRILSQPVAGFNNEVILRKKLWQMAMASESEWILILDADEIFETKAVTELPQLLGNARGIDCFSFRLYDMWNVNYYREDQYWQAHKVYRPLIVRKIPDFKEKWQETPQHCGRFPLNIAELKGAVSDLRVKHLGWQKAEDRLRKYYRYKELDPQALYGIKEQYESILAPQPNLIPWAD
ncbi:glycosyltransferase family 2 protein [Desulfosporosinus sp. PR]|uniref:glycosyltransferase n=1 Tax=Candidatus Desulfosporosinus nitrosoreducens TaxID=3401928 RepID=UPI0027FABD6E|nr:glycosyltransferase [Desulfosporosinus sp. PR]MDQ7097170.1 glycosyltransferase family 2 protein [Desulfosporosinus sp. PR]